MRLSDKMRLWRDKKRIVISESSDHMYGKSLIGYVDNDEIIQVWYERDRLLAYTQPLKNCDADYIRMYGLVVGMVMDEVDNKKK